ncbi:MAG: DUF2184 domain-containing protein [Polyangiaceae bacterium]|nr:DUF2184 domain-containing protein [Polyangiaceae bacterium]
MDPQELIFHQRVDAAQVALIAAEIGLRLDANETAVFARQLEFVRAQTYDIEYPELKARRLIPVANDVDPAAEEFTYRQFDFAGRTKVITNPADDSPLVDVQGKEFTSKIITLGDSYAYSVFDLQRASRVGWQIDQKRAMAAREVAEFDLDDLAAVGNAETGLPGLLNHSDIQLTTADTGAWLTGPKTPLQIIGDMNKLAKAPFLATKERHAPDTMLLPTDHFGHIASTPMSVDNNTTILQFFLRNTPWIRNVEPWYRLATAGAGGATRSMVYRRSPLVMELLISQEFTQLPPQARNYAFVVPCFLRAGGLKLYRPLACRYMDSI